MGSRQRSFNSSHNLFERLGVYVDLNSALFYILAAVAALSALSVVLIANPLYSALLLAVTMLGVAGIYFTLEAYFLAGVQLIVYAGAVMVMFVMVLMLFDLKNERQPFSGGFGSFLLKMATCGWLVGVIFSSIKLSGQFFSKAADGPAADGVVATKELATQLFAKHLFSFELVGVLLLVVLVGAIALARSRGGTHA